MRDSGVGAIPVRVDGQLVGIVTDRDITCRVVAVSGDLSKLTAQDVMTKNVICCSPEDDIATAIKEMEAMKIRRLPVTDSNRVMVGMLSLVDISQKATKELFNEVLSAVSVHHL